MREELTAREVEILLAFADCDMKTTLAAKSLKMHRSSFWRAMQTIFRETGYNPLEFWDLHQIMKALEQEEGANEDNSADS